MGRAQYGEAYVMQQKGRMITRVVLYFFIVHADIREINIMIALRT